MSYGFGEMLGEECRPCPSCGVTAVGHVRSEAFYEHNVRAYLLRCNECESVFDGKQKLPIIGIQVFCETYQRAGEERVKLQEGWLVGDITSSCHEVDDRPFIPPATFGFGDAEDELREMKILGSFQDFSHSLDECILRWAKGFLDLLLSDGFSVVMDKGSGEWCWVSKPESVEGGFEGEEVVETIRLTGVPAKIGRDLASRTQPKAGG